MPVTELVRSEIAKNLAEAKAAEELAKSHAAEAKYHAAEARKSILEAECGAIGLAALRRTEADELARDRFHHVYAFNESVSAGSVAKCMLQLNTWTRQSEKPLTIEIVLNSPGGDVIAGMALWDHLKVLQAQGHTIITSCVGMAASMAGILLQAGDRRVMGREAYVLIHEIAFGAGGKIGEIEDEVAFGKKIQERILAILASRSTLSEKQIAGRWRRKDWWLDSDECLRLGFVDEIR